jgi:hypothetical protein
MLDAEQGIFIITIKGYLQHLQILATLLTYIFSQRRGIADVSYSFWELIPYPL